MAKALGVDDRVHWLGWLPQPECAKHLQGATALLLPSIYECGGAVVLEAMACAVPVIALAWGGPAEYVDRTCGILISPSDSDSIIEGFTEAQSKLAAERSCAHVWAMLVESGWNFILIGMEKSTAFSASIGKALLNFAPDPSAVGPGLAFTTHD
jgi:glycosyltransferase involved in cell wall biosynthesis